MKIFHIWGLFLQLLLLFLTFLAIQNLFYLLVHRALPSSFSMAFLFFVIALSHLSRKKIENRLLRMSLSVLLPMSLLFLYQEDVDLIYLVPLIMGIVIYNLYKCSGEGARMGDNVPMVACLLFILDIFLLNYLEAPVPFWIKGAGELLILLSVLLRNWTSLRDQIENKGGITHIPLKQVFKANRMAMSLVVLFCVLLICFANMTDLGSIAEKIHDIWYFLFTSFLKWLFRNKGEDVYPYLPDQGDDAVLGSMEPEVTEVKPNVILMAIQNVIMVVVLTAAFLFLVMCIYKAVRRYLLSMADNGSTEEEKKEMILPEWKLKQKGQKEKWFFLTRDYNEKVRKKYAIKIRKSAEQKKEKIGENMTPSALSERYLSMQEEKERLTALYEKARYKKEGITEQEWKEYHEIDKKNKGRF